MSALRVTTWIWMLLVLIVMWYPNTHLAGVNLGSLWVQMGAFGIGAALLALADAGPDEALLMFGSQNQAPQQSRSTILRGAIVLVGYAGVLELGQWFAPERQSSFTRFFENAATVLVVSALCYVVGRLVLSNRELQRRTAQRLSGTAAAFRSEISFASDLRDAVQAAHAITLDPRLSADEKVERVRATLSDALGAKAPDRDDELLEETALQSEAQTAASSQRG
jgi:hypothetical protein